MSSVAAQARPRPSDPVHRDQHLILRGVSWALYEKVLADTGDQAIRVTFDQGRMEIMSPRWDHENPARVLGRMVEMLTLELDMEIASGGSMTLRDPARQLGTEPDQCYFFKHAARIRAKRGRWTAGKDPAPDLVIEVDLTSPSLPRQPIYAALGVPELWRWNGKTVACLHLKDSQYQPQTHSLAFPTLEVGKLKRFISMLGKRDENAVVREFVKWVRQCSE